MFLNELHETLFFVVLFDHFDGLLDADIRSEVVAVADGDLDGFFHKSGGQFPDGLWPGGSEHEGLAVR